MGLALPVELIGYGQRIGVGLDDAVKLGPFPVEPLDAVEVILNQLPCGETASLHIGLQPGDGGLVQG